MTLDLISRAEARIAEHETELAKLRQQALEHEGGIVALNMFIDMAKELAGDEIGLSFLDAEPQPSPAAQTEPEAIGHSSAVAAPASVESAAPIQPETANDVGEAQKVERRSPEDAGSIPATCASAGSSNGRTAEFDSANDGSNPSPVANSVSAPAVTLTDTIEPKRRIKLIDKIKAVLADHPDWSARQIADAIGSKQKFVNAAAEKAGIEIRRLTPEERRETRRTGKPFGDTSEKKPAPALPATPIASTKPAGVTLTLKDRVRICHEQHPNWTARMIANEIGAPYTSVSTTLSQVRSEGRKGEPHNPAKGKPEFANRNEMLAHYDDIAKRLGKPA